MKRSDEEWRKLADDDSEPMPEPVGRCRCPACGQVHYRRRPGKEAVG